MDDEQRHIIKATRVFGKPNLFSASLGRQTYKQAATEMAAVRFFLSAYSANAESVRVLYKRIPFPKCYIFYFVKENH